MVIHLVSRSTLSHRVVIKLKLTQQTTTNAVSSIRRRINCINLFVNSFALQSSAGLVSESLRIPFIYVSYRLLRA